MELSIREASRRLDCKPDTLYHDVISNPAWFAARKDFVNGRAAWLIDDQSEGYRAWEARPSGLPGRKGAGGDQYAARRAAKVLPNTSG